MKLTSTIVVTVTMLLGLVAATPVAVSDVALRAAGKAQNINRYYKAC